MTAPRETPRPVRYVALPAGDGDCGLLAVHPDGRLAINFYPLSGVPAEWKPVDAPDWAALYPEELRRAD